MVAVVIHTTFIRSTHHPVCKEPQGLIIRLEVEVADLELRRILPLADPPDVGEIPVTYDIEYTPPCIVTEVLRTFGHERVVVPYQAVDHVLVHDLAIRDEAYLLVVQTGFHETECLHGHPAIIGIPVMGLHVELESMFIHDGFETVLQPLIVTVLGMTMCSFRTVFVLFHLRILEHGDVAGIEMEEPTVQSQGCMYVVGDVVEHLRRARLEHPVETSAESRIVQR